MTKTEAIILIEERIKKLESNNFDPIVWTSGTISVLKRIFIQTGYKKTNDLEEISHSIQTPMADSSLQERHKDRAKNQARNFLGEYINEINTFGLESSEKVDNKHMNEQGVVGRTFWDVFGTIFSKKPTIVIATLIGVVLLFLILVFTGFLKFEIVDGNVSMGFNPAGQIASESNSNSDQENSWCITKGIELNKKYVLKTIVQTYDAELRGKQKDTLVVKERIIYDILALKDITKAENIFKEGYSSNVAFKVDRWFGSEREKPLHMGNETTYYVHFYCKKGESITIMTGADFYYTFPLRGSRNSPFRDYNLNSNEDLWIYPNEEDVIGKLTMIWSSQDIKLQQISGSALHSYSSGEHKVNDDRDAFYNSDENSQSENNSVSASWKNILPDEQFALKIKWHQ